MIKDKISAVVIIPRSWKIPFWCQHFQHPTNSVPGAVSPQGCCSINNVMSPPLLLLTDKNHNWGQSVLKTNVRAAFWRYSISPQVKWWNMIQKIRLCEWQVSYNWNSSTAVQLNPDIKGIKTGLPKAMEDVSIWKLGWVDGIQPVNCLLCCLLTGQFDLLN